MYAISKGASQGMVSRAPGVSNIEVQLRIAHVGSTRGQHCWKPLPSPMALGGNLREPPPRNSNSQLDLQYLKQQALKKTYSIESMEKALIWIADALMRWSGSQML